VIHLLVITYVARYLEPENFGKLSYAQNFVGLFTAFVTLGLPRILVRELVKTPDKSRELLGSAGALMLLGSALAIGLLNITTYFLDVSELERWMILIIGAGLVFQSANVIDFYFQSQVRSRYVVQAQTLQLVASSIVKLALVWTQAELICFAAVSVIDALVLALGLLYVYTHYAAAPAAIHISWRFQSKIATELLKSSWPLILSSMAITVYMKIDQIMIREMLDAAAVGQYAAAVSISEVWYFIPVAITTSVFPAIIRSRENSRGLYHDRLQQLFKLMVLLAVAVAVPTTFFSSEIIAILFGADYSQAASILTIHIWAAIFVFINNTLQQWYIAEGLEKLSAARTTIGLLINILLNYLLIKQYGVIGAAWATLISRAMVGFVLNFIFLRTRPMFWMILHAFTLGTLKKNHV
jgi:O-antigen/teichoic acid export membrane protein